MSHTLSLDPLQGPHAAKVDLGGDGGEERPLAQVLSLGGENKSEKRLDDGDLSGESTVVVLTDKGELEGSQGVGGLPVGIHQ